MAKILGNYKYITNRVLQDNMGKQVGSIAVRVPKDSDTAQVRYKCPECQHTEMKEQPWKRPFLVKCAGCGITMKIPKLKDELKKEKKKASK